MCLFWGSSSSAAPQQRGGPDNTTHVDQPSEHAVTEAHESSNIPKQHVSDEVELCGSEPACDGQYPHSDHFEAIDSEHRREAPMEELPSHNPGRLLLQAKLLHSSMLYLTSRLA